MGLEEFTESEENEEEEDEQDYEEPNRGDSTKRAIAANIQSRCMTNDMDIEVSGGRVEGDIEDLAMLFALMTMDYSESDFYDLVTDDLED